MSKKLTQLYTTAHDAVEQMATAPGTRPFDRAELLGRLRNRISDQIMRISNEIGAQRGDNPVSQREGD